MLLWISSGRKLRGSIQVPASMPATLRPARAKGSTATPPAAPSPITATSTGFRLVAMFASIERLPVRRGGRLHTLVLGPHGHLRAGITDEIPAGEVFVAAVGGIAEHAFEREPARAVEEAAQV